MQGQISDAVRQEIMRRIRATEAEHQVRVLYAVESGSRAWGFASPNSDYDVRFIYAHPQDGYLALDLEHRRDVIEYPIVDEIDLSGWDLRKALQLLARSNPSIVEWLLSPIVYVDCGAFAQRARTLLPDLYSPTRGIYHYRSMACTNYRRHLLGDRVSLKKYLYVLRALLSIQWLERYAEPAPIEFARLRALVTPGCELDQAIGELLARKAVCTEQTLEPAVRPLNRFIEAELQRLDALKLPKVSADDPYPSLNRLFRQLLAEER